MRIIEIVEHGLKQNNFDGLVSPGVCGCLIGDLSPGGCLAESCQGGFKHTHSKTGEWITSIRRDGVTDDDIECMLE